MIALVSLGMLALGGCGDDSDDSAGENGGNDAAAAAQTITVTATDFEFDQNAITLAPGEIEVTLVNEGEVQHSFSGTEGLGFDVVANPGEEASTTFTLPKGDTFPFTCRFHPDEMRGAIHVGE